MSIPDGGNGFRHELELVVTTELTLSQTSQAEVAVDGTPESEWPLDPEAQRYEAYLGTLLGAVEALEDGVGPDDPAAQAEAAPGAAPTGVDGD